MDPTQNQSGTPGPIFSAGPAPEEPPMAPAPTGSGPKNPFSGNDIILQPSNDYYSGGAKPRSKKSIIIIGAIAVVAVIALLVMLPLFSRSSGEDATGLREDLYFLATDIHDRYSSIIDSYNEIIGSDPTTSSLIKEPTSILFYQYGMYDSLYNEGEFIRSSLADIQDITQKLHKYEAETDFIAENTQAHVDIIMQNANTMRSLNQAFITPIQNAENWQYLGCVSSSETQSLLNSSDKKLANIAQKYNQLACKDDVQITFSDGELHLPKSVDAATAELLSEIASSLANYFGALDASARDEVLDKLQTIINETKPEDVEAVTE